MNIFVLDECPEAAAQYQCDKHIVKMPTETVQMLVSALLLNGAPEHLMPIAKTTGEPHRGGYKNHPCTRWAAESYDNFMWLYEHGEALCAEYQWRYGKEHAALSQLHHILAINWAAYLYMWNGRTPFVRALNQSVGRNLDLLDIEKYSAVQAYRKFYVREKHGFARWEKGTRRPKWFGEEFVEEMF